MSVKEKSGWYNRDCRWPTCDEPMADLSKRVYCNDHLDRVVGFLSRVRSGYYGETYTTGRDQPEDLETDGGRPIEDIAADDGLEPGVTPHGDRVHLVDFDSRSMLVRGTEGASDKLLCGRAGNYERADAPENGDEWCDPCLDRFLGYKFGLVDAPEGVRP